MKLMITALAALLGVSAAQAEEIFPVVAKDQFTNGIILRGYCASNLEAAKAYVSGWHDKRSVDITFSQFPASRLPDDISVQRAHWSVAGSFCLPKDITLQALTDVVCAHVIAHPEIGAYLGVGQIERALDAKYPCPVRE